MRQAVLRQVGEILRKYLDKGTEYFKEKYIYVHTYVCVYVYVIKIKCCQIGLV